jgi:hypothetical protein
MNIKKKDRKTDRQKYKLKDRFTKKCGRMKERRQFFEEEDINTIMIMFGVKN